MKIHLFFLSAAVLAGGAAAQEPHDHGHHADHQHAEHQGAEHGAEYQHHEVHHDFSDAERWTQVFDSEERREWQKPDEVVSLMEVEPGMTVADLGAGTGFFLGYLAAAVGKGGAVLGLEPEANLIDFMKERREREGWSNVTPRRVPYDSPGLEDGEADRVLVVNTWHHIEDREHYSQKLHRALKPGGRVYVVDFTKDSPSGPPPEHRLEPQQIMDELRAGGFEVELLEETLPRQFVVVGRR